LDLPVVPPMWRMMKKSSGSIGGLERVLLLRADPA
jgi:hypothetical protein